MWKIIKKLGRILRGGVAGRDIFLGVFFGFAVGMTPGMNLTMLIFLALLLLFNSNLVMAALATAVGRCLAIIIAPLTFELGYAMIHKMGLAGLVSSFADTPVLALLDLQVYCLMGALPIIIIVGLGGAWFVSRSITKMQKAVVAASQNNEKFSKFSQNKVVKFIMRLAFGKQKQELAVAMEKKSPLFNRKRIIVAVVLMVIIVGFSFCGLDWAVKKGMESGIGSVNGAEVNVKNVDLSLSTGNLVIEGLQVTDPAKPEQNKVQAAKLQAKISVKDLLKKQLVVDIIACDDMAMDAKRDKSGEVYLTEQQQQELASQQAAQESQTPAISGLGDTKKYYDQVKKFNDQLNKLKEYLSKRSEDARQDSAVAKQQMQEDAKTQGGYFGLSASELLAKHPTWLIVEGKVTKFKMAANFPSFTIEAKNVSSNPSLVKEPFSLVAKPDDTAFKDFVNSTIGSNPAVKDIKEKTGGMLDKINIFKKN